MRFPPEKIDEIRDATDIIDLVGAYVKLKRRGKNYVGLCPFHTEKTPSFSVSSDKQMYYCFGCQRGGNAFTFLMELEKVSFQEAVRTLAERAGIALPQIPSDDAAASESEALYQACTHAARFFHYNLTQTVEGKLALEYFRYRGFSDETINSFGLGYSLNSWDALIKHAEDQGLSLDVLERAGLVRRREDGSGYDYFRGRAMFPIFSTSGRVIGFGARKLREDDPVTGKYINSPETSIYNKSRILYGLYNTKEAIRESDSAILVEGYVDLITLFQAGVRNVVATSGTALTPEQIQLLARYTKNVSIVYDADSAGSKAALRGVDLMLEQDLDVHVAQLPNNEDPDSFVKKKGADAFTALVGSAKSFVDFVASTYEQQGTLQSPEGQAQAVRGIVQTIARMKDELKRQFYVKHVAEKYKLYESVLYRELERYSGRRTGAGVSVSRGTGQGPLAAQRIPIFQEAQSEVAAEPSDVPAAERDVLRLMLEGDPSLIDLVFQHLSLSDFTHPHTRALAAIIRDAREVQGSVDASRLVNEVDDSNVKRLVAHLVFSKYELSKGWKESGIDVVQAQPEQLVHDAIVAFRRRSLERQVEENQQQLKEATSRGEDVMDLLARRQQLLEQMKSILNARSQSS